MKKDKYFMNHFFNDQGFTEEIVIENGSIFLSSENMQLIESELNKVQIGFTYIELRSGLQNSLFDGIFIFINENLTSLILSGLLMPGVYDALKFAIKTIRYGLENSNFRIVSTNKISTPTPILRFKTKKGDIKAPIPNDLTDNQFEKYMNVLNEAMRDISNDIIEEKELIAEYESDSERIKIRTLSEYFQGQCRSSKKR